MLATRIARTAYKNSHPDPLQPASTAIHPDPNANPPPYEESKDMPPVLDKKMSDQTEDSSDETSKEELKIATSLDKIDISSVTQVHVPVAIFPQYVAKTPTTLVLEEKLTRPEGEFSIRDESDIELFKVHRDRPSLTMRQTITDVRTHQAIVVIRRDAISFPTSYHFEDPDGNKILRLRGNPTIPVAGTRAKAIFKNALNGNEIQIETHGNWRLRKGEIKNAGTGEGLALISSDLFTPKSLIGKRRNYAVRIAAGVDIVLISALIISMDSRTK